MKEALKTPLYVKILLADIISNFGDILYYLALLNYVLQLDRSNLAVSIINLSEILPILSSFVLGYLADRTRRRYEAITGTLILRIIIYVIIACIMEFSPSLLIVAAVSLFNFISDCAGQYENGLYYPISNRMVRDEIREEVMAFRQSFMLTLNILFKAFGGVMILYLSFSKLALIDAASFLISMLIIIGARKEFLIYCSDSDAFSKPDKISIGSLRKELGSAISRLWQMSEIRDTLAVIPVLNAGLAIVTPVAVLCMADNPGFCIINPAITISMLAMCEPAGRIVGSALTISLLKKISLRKALQIVLLITAVLLLGIVLQNIYIVLPAMFFASFWTGCIDPKMGAIIFNNLEEGMLATAFGGMTTYFQLGDIASRLILSAIVLLLSPPAIAAVYAVVVVGALAYITMNGNTKGKEEA
ncbi:MAG: MFS transporter [Lachnospiraceae bacterium]|nr:MFS transporter [Lachnospiraceae bacterium]